MTRPLPHENPLEGLPPRAKIAELILGGRPPRDTYVGWQHYRTTCGLLVPAPKISLQQWPAIENRQSDYDLYRQLTNANLPLQDTPMHDKVGKLIRRRLRGNTMKQDDPTRAGVMISGWGNYGKTASVCSAAAVFEDQWPESHSYLSPGALPGARDLHAPVVCVSTPVTAPPKSLCASILGFFRAPTRKTATLPELVRQVAESLHAHGVKALILDDISRLRMHRADDQDVLDLMRAFMSLNVTLILTGVNISGIGLLREAKWNKRTRQWEMPPLESTRIHGLEITQTEHRFELIELDRFRYTTPEQIQAFVGHLEGIEQHLRLLNAKEGMLTGGTMPKYLMRRTGGVVGPLGRLLDDGAQEAMESEKELIDEGLPTRQVKRRRNTVSTTTALLAQRGVETSYAPITPKLGSGVLAGRRRGLPSERPRHDPRHLRRALSDHVLPSR